MQIKNTYNNLHKKQSIKRVQQIKNTYHNLHKKQSIKRIQQIKNTYNNLHKKQSIKRIQQIKNTYHNLHKKQSIKRVQQEMHQPPPQQPPPPPLSIHFPNGPLCTHAHTHTHTHCSSVFYYSVHRKGARSLTSLMPSFFHSCCFIQSSCAVSRQTMTAPPFQQV